MAEMPDYAIPRGFPPVLKGFVREALRAQPPDIYEYGAAYFTQLASPVEDLQRAADEAAAAAGEDQLDLAQVESMVNELFQTYDTDASGTLDPKEFRALMNDLQTRLGFPETEVYRFLSEADTNADGVIEYGEFIPLALQIIEGIYSARKVAAMQAEAEEEAEALLVHGMSREELTETVAAMFDSMDADKSGKLNKQEFMAALQRMDLGLTRREINVIMVETDADGDGQVDYREFVPVAFDLLKKLTTLRLLETEMQQDELAAYLQDMFRAGDKDSSGLLHLDDMRDLLFGAQLGLSRMQIHACLSASRPNDAGLVNYEHAVPSVTKTIRSMLNFQNQLVDEIDHEAEIAFYDTVDAALEPCGGHCTFEEFEKLLMGCGVMNELEVLACVAIARKSKTTTEVDIAAVRPDLWSVVKHVRRAQR